MMNKNSKTVFETEKKFRCNNVDELIKHAESLWFIKEYENLGEHDIYFTDKEHTFIDKRICLRIRQTDVHCEITHKGHSHDTWALYSKKETNIQLQHHNKEDAIYLLESLWFLKYVEIKKTRQLYSKTIESYIYNIAIDYIEHWGHFVELEIISQEAIPEYELHNIFANYRNLFKQFNLEEETLPYRDIIKNILSE